MTSVTPGARSLRLLLVEDHEDCLMMLQMLLEMWGHRVTPARSIEAALKASGEAEFDCVISDLGLPDGSGLTLIRQLRQRASIHGIALSGSACDDDVRASLSAGFGKHLAKPVEVDELEAALAALASH